VPLARHARDDLRGIPGYVRALFLVLFLCSLALFSVSKESHPTATRWATVLLLLERCDPSTEIGRRLRQAWTRREPTAAHEIGSFEL
jgi:hypothetical protein